MSAPISPAIVDRLATTARLPVRPHLRPHHFKRIFTAADIDPRLLAAHPRLVEELNAVIVYVRHRDDWMITDMTLDLAMALSISGEA